VKSPTNVGSNEVLIDLSTGSPLFQICLLVSALRPLSPGSRGDLRGDWGHAALSIMNHSTTNLLLLRFIVSAAFTL